MIRLAFCPLGVLLVTSLAVMATPAPRFGQEAGAIGKTIGIRPIVPMGGASRPAATERGNPEGRHDDTGRRPPSGINGFGNSAGKK